MTGLTSGGVRICYRPPFTNLWLTVHAGVFVLHDVAHDIADGADEFPSCRTLALLSEASGTGLAAGKRAEQFRRDRSVRSLCTQPSEHFLLQFEGGKSVSTLLDTGGGFSCMDGLSEDEGGLLLFGLFALATGNFVHKGEPVAGQADFDFAP